MSSDKAKLFSFSEMLKQQRDSTTSPPQNPTPTARSIPQQPEPESRPAEPEAPTQNIASIPQGAQLKAHTPPEQVPGIPEVRTPTRTSRQGDKSPTTTTSGIPQTKTPASHKSDRHKGGRVRYQGRVSPEFYKQVKRFCIDHELEIQDFMELSGVHYMQYVVSHKEADVDGKDTLNEVIMFKTNEDIIMLYRQYTGNKWKPLDDRAAVRFNDTDRRCLELAIIQTLGNFKGKRINGFAYFIPEIENMLELNIGGETLDVMLKQRRRQCEQMFQRAGK